MTNEQIDELLALEAKATPGPWNVSCSYEGSLTICQMRACSERRCVNAYSDSQSPCGYEAFEENAALIAAARNNIRELGDEVKRLRAAMAADDERLRIAGERTGLPFDCDTPEHMADELLFLRGEVERLRAEVVHLWGATDNTGTEAQKWLTLAKRLSRLEEPFRSKNIAICLASAFRQGKMNALIENAKQVQDGMSPEERNASREKAVLSFAYGNVAMSNPSVTMDDIRKAAAELKARASLRTIFHDDGQIVTVRDRVED